MPFKYKKVLVIGATSGIGRALAARFVSEESSVIAVGRRKENLDELQKESGGSDKVDTVVYDVTDFKNAQSFADNITTKHPDLDLVIFNSGMQRHLDWTKPAEVDLDLLETEFTTNYTAFMHLTKAFLPFLQKQAPKEVALVYVTSGLALVPIAYCPNYCATKAALHHMVLAMRMQLKDANSNVKIIELLPPAVQTELHDDKHQPQFQGRGRNLGMPLQDFVDEAYAGLNADDNEQIPVQAVKAFMGYNEWEQKRQETMAKFHEMNKQRGH